MTAAALAFALVFFLAMVRRQADHPGAMPHLRLPLLVLLAVLALWHPQLPPSHAPAPPRHQPRSAGLPIACTPDAGAPDGPPSTMLAEPNQPVRYAGELQAIDVEHTTEGFVVGAPLR